MNYSRGYPFSPASVAIAGQLNNCARAFEFNHMSIIVREAAPCRIYFKLFNYTGVCPSASPLLSYPDTLALQFDLKAAWRLHLRHAAWQMLRIRRVLLLRLYLSFISPCKKQRKQVYIVYCVIYELRKNNFNCAIKSTINFQSIITITTKTTTTIAQLQSPSTSQSNLCFNCNQNKSKTRTHKGELYMHVCVRWIAKVFEYILNFNRVNRARAGKEQERIEARVDYKHESIDTYMSKTIAQSAVL